MGMVFGRKLEGCCYVERPGSYGIISNTDDRILLVKDGGGYFLPGGRKDSGESDEDCLLRGIREELGCKAVSFQKIGEASEYISSDTEENYFYPGVFYLIDEYENIGGHVETDQLIEWKTPEEAVELLDRKAQVWAVKESFFSIDFYESGGQK